MDKPENIVFQQPFPNVGIVSATEVAVGKLFFLICWETELLCWSQIVVSATFHTLGQTTTISAGNNSTSVLML